MIRMAQPSLVWGSRPPAADPSAADLNKFPQLYSHIGAVVLKTLGLSDKHPAASVAIVPLSRIIISDSALTIGDRLRDH
jgi:hypothetical protein